MIKRMQMLLSLNGLAKSIGAIPVPHGPNATYIGAVVLLILQWFKDSAHLMPDAALPWAAIGITVLSGIHAITALFAGTQGSWTTSATKALIVQILVTSGQALTQFSALAASDWQPYIQDGLQVIQLANSVDWLHREAR